MEIDNEDVVGRYMEDGSIKGVDAMTTEDWETMKKNDVLTRDMLKEEKTYFCDVTGEQL